MFSLYTSQLLFATQPAFKQVETARNWLQQEDDGLRVVMETSLQLKPYAMALLCVILPEHEKHTDLIKKSLKNITEKDYLWFKYEGLVPNLKEHKESHTAFENLNKKILKIEAVKNQASYDRLGDRIRELIVEGKTKEFFALAEQIDIRRVPLFPSENLSYDIVKASNSSVWPPTLHMLCKDQAPEEA